MDTLNTPPSEFRLPQGSSLGMAILVAAAITLPVERLHQSTLFVTVCLALSLLPNQNMLAMIRQIGKPALFLIAGIALSSFFSEHAAKGWVVVRNIVLAMATGSLFSHLATRHGQAFTRAAKLAVLMLTILGSLAVVLIPDLWTNMMQKDFSQLKVLANENSWGLSLALLGNTALVAGMTARTQSERTGLIAICAGIMAFLYITELSRGALVSSLMTCGMVCLFARTKGSLLLRLMIPASALAFFGISLLMVAATLLPPEYFYRIDHLLTERLSIYKVCWDAINESLLWGHGARTFAINMTTAMLEAAGERLGTPHNILLEALYSLGLMGMALWIAGISQFWRLPGSNGRMNGPARSFIRMLGASILMQLLFHGLVDLSIFSSYFLNLLFISGALIHATNRPMIPGKKMDDVAGLMRDGAADARQQTPTPAPLPLQQRTGH